MKGYNFMLDGKKINTDDIKFISVTYINDKDMDITIHFKDKTMYRTISNDKKLFLKVDEYVNIIKKEK